MPFRRFLIIIVTFLFICQVRAEAQFIHFQMEVETELSTNVLQDFSFGDLITNSGTTQVELGGPGMGIFEIRGLNNQRLMVSLNAPSYLSHTSDGTEEQIPIKIEASYNNHGDVNDISQAQPFLEGSLTEFTLGESTSQSNQSSWESAYIYVYGSIDVGEVPTGLYEGSIVLTVEYQ